MTVNRDCGGRAGSARPVAPLPSRAHLGGCCHPQQVPLTHSGVRLVSAEANFSTNRFPTSEAPFGVLYHPKIGHTEIESDPLFKSKQQ